MSTSHKVASIRHGPSSPADNRKSRRFKGVRMRKWGKWVSEVRIPNCKEKIWLGSFDTPDQAARAFDAATYCLRGPLAKFNFPNSLPAIPSATPLSPQQIRQAAVNYALGLIPSDESASNVPENATPPPPPPPMPPQASRLSVSSEMGASSEAVEELDSTMWDSLFADSDYFHSLDLKNFPFLQPSTSPREEQGPLLFDDIADLT